MGVDPGEKTGIALVQLKDGTFTCVGALEAVGIPEILGVLNRHKPTHIVMETFALYPWTAKSLSWNRMVPSQVIGAIKAWCHQQPKAPVLVEQPASVRGGIKQPILRALGCERLLKGKPHARDALRHALWYCWRQWPDLFIRYMRSRGWNN